MLKVPMKEPFVDQAALSDDESKRRSNSRVELYLMDCAGQTVFNQVEQNREHYENASYVVVVYDVASRESFDSAGKWLQAVRQQKGASGTPTPGVLVANKVDLRALPAGGAVITAKEGAAFAKSVGLHFVEASAEKGERVDEPFLFIANEVRACKLRNGPSKSRATPAVVGNGRTHRGRCRVRY
jgi:small GTP-binding protein